MDDSRNLTNTQRERALVDAYLAGAVSVPAVAARFEVTTVAARAMLAAHGVPVRRGAITNRQGPGRQLTDAQKQAICAAYVAGKSGPVLAKEFDTTCRVVFRVLIHHGIERRPFGEPSPDAVARLQQQQADRDAERAARVAELAARQCPVCGGSMAGRPPHAVVCAAARCRQQRNYRLRQSDPAQVARAEAARQARVAREPRRA